MFLKFLLKNLKTQVDTETGYALLKKSNVTRNTATVTYLTRSKAVYLCWFIRSARAQVLNHYK